MHKLLILFILACLTTKYQAENPSIQLSCSSNQDCAYPNGQCVLTQCNCSKGWIIVDQTGCTYQLKSKLTAFLLSFFVGTLGVDWFYLSCGTAAYIIVGIIKLITFGGLGIWWLIDWIRLLANAFLDGNGFPLTDWNN